MLPSPHLYWVSLYDNKLFGAQYIHVCHIIAWYILPSSFIQFVASLDVEFSFGLAAAPLSVWGLHPLIDMRFAWRPQDTSSHMRLTMQWLAGI